MSCFPLSLVDVTFGQWCCGRSKMQSSVIPLLLSAGTFPTGLTRLPLQVLPQKGSLCQQGISGLCLWGWLVASR